MCPDTEYDYLIIQPHEAVSVVVIERGLGRVTADGVAGISIGKALNRECWS